MKKSLLLLSTLFIGLSNNAQDWDWLNSTGGNGFSEGWDLAMTIDNWNNSITVGKYTSASITFGSTTLTNFGPADTEDGFVVKTDKDGAVLWARSIEGVGYEQLYDVDVDAAGNIYATGVATVSSTVNFGGGVSFTTTDSDAAFVVKYDKFGNPIWVRETQLKNSGSGAIGRGIEVDDVGTVYWAGSFDCDTIMFGGVELANTNWPTGSDSYVVKLTPGGSPILGSATGMDVDEAISIVLTPMNNVVVGANFLNASVTIGSDVLTNPGPGELQGAVVKLTNALAPIWARELGGTLAEQINDIAVDGLGNIYACGGTFSGDMTFASTPISSFGVNMFLCHYDAMGNEIKVLQATFGSPGIAFGTSIDLHTNEDIYITGYHDLNNADIGGVSTTWNSHFDSFLMRLDSAFTGVWLEQLTGSDSIQVNCMAHDEWGNIYVGGWWKGSGLQAGTNAAFHTAAEYDVFMARFNNACSLDVSVSTNNATCGDSDGDATATVTGGSSPYEYSWTSGDTLAFADSLAAGLYQVTVTDAFGCTGFGVALISDISGPTISVVPGGTNNIMCPGGSDGTIQISVSGGTSPYDVDWSTGDTVLVLSGLTSGPYDVIVTDAVGCTSMQTVTLTEPDPLDFDVSTTDASCTSNDGQASVTMSGGTPGYMYSWSSGGSGSTETGLGVGSYMLTVQDANGCSDSTLVLINEAGGPVIVIDSVDVPSCANGGIGNVYISVSGTGPFNYLWTDMSTGQDLLNVGPGNHAVMVTDVGTGCSSMEYGLLPSVLPPVQEICVVKVDSASGFNLVVWEKDPLGDYLSHYNIYQEQTVAGVFNYVGSVPYDSLSQYVDSLANPIVRSYRYVITAVDTCGNESNQSTIHQTIHLAASLAVNQTDVNCSWNHYDGFWYGTYDVFRYTDVAGWQQMPSFPSTSAAWTDITVPGGWNDMHYIISVDHPDGCTSTRAEDHNSTRSNEGRLPAPSGPITVNEIPSDVRAVVFPNPNDGIMELGLFVDQEQDIDITVYNLMGEVVYTDTYSNVFGEQFFTIDVTTAASGIYVMELATQSGRISSRFVKE